LAVRGRCNSQARAPYGAAERDNEGCGSTTSPPHGAVVLGPMVFIFFVGVQLYELQVARGEIGCCMFLSDSLTLP